MSKTKIVSLRRSAMTLHHLVSSLFLGGGESEQVKTEGLPLNVAAN